MNATRRRRVCVAAGVLTLGLAASARADLRAEQLLLITNSRVPQSAAVAKHYAQARHVPAANVLELDVPPGEEVAPEVYDQRIAAPVAAFLRSPAGKDIRCLVTVFGVPLRVGLRPVTDADRAETQKLRQLVSDLETRAVHAAEPVDAAAKAAGLTVPPTPLNGILAARQHFQSIIDQAKAATPPPPSMVEMLQVAQRAVIESSQQAMASVFPPSPVTAPAAGPAELQALANRPRDAAARDVLRREISRQGGVFPLHQVVEQQLNWVNGDETDAAVDNELALVLVGDLPRYRWQANALHYRVTSPPTPQIMVCRIDAPTALIANRLIDDTIETEAIGLDGKVVFDSRGLPAMKDGQLDGYGWYDQTIRDAAVFVKANTNLTVVTDDREQVLPPRAVPGTALYCGWYSLRNYVPSCGFVTGAVGYHVASLELVALHDGKEKGWVANLLKDGVVATLGAVSEPYLSSFPRPEEFFPLLMTGKPTMAEIFWATNPMTSWKIAFIGDPLYRPFAKRPALKVEQLPAELRKWLEKTEAASVIGR